MRSIEVEITIGGIGLVWITKPEGTQDLKTRGPERGREPVVLFPPDHPGEEDGGHGGHGGTGRHTPYLHYFAEDNLLLPEQARLEGSVEGREVVSVPLAGRRVFFEPPFPYPRENMVSTLCWASPNADGTLPELPRSTDDDDCMDWLLDADDIGLLHPDPRRAVTVIHLPEGHLFARNVFRNRQSDELAPVRWQIGGRRQAIARETVLRMENLWQRLRIRIAPLSDVADTDRSAADTVLELLPGGSNVLRIGLTNLPDTYDGRDSHLEILGELDPNARIDTPSKLDPVRCIQATCENGYKIGGTFVEQAAAAALSVEGLAPPAHLSTSGLQRAWDRGRFGRPEVRVAIIDTGIDTREGARRYLKDKVDYAWDSTGEAGRRPWLDQDGHGTMMASIVAAEHHPGDPVCGVAPAVRLLSFRVVSRTGGLEAGAVLPDAVAKLRREAKPHGRVHVALLAVQVERNAKGMSGKALEAVRQLGEEDVLVVVAAGEGLDPWPDPRLAALPHVLVVGRVDDAESQLLSNGDAGSIHLAAPGSGIRVANRYGGDRTSGSSAAAALVAGAAALAFSEDPAAPATEVRQRILDTARPVDALDGKVATGGVLDVGALLRV